MGRIYNLQNKVNHNNTIYFSFIRDIIRWRIVAEEKKIFVYQCNLYSVIFIIYLSKIQMLSIAWMCITFKVKVDF